MIDYARLELGPILIHQITKESGPNGPTFKADLTDEPVGLSPQDKSFLTGRFQEALMRLATPVLEDSGTPSPTPSVIRNHWENPDIVTVSKLLTGQLVATQKGSAKGGVLVVADATNDGDDVLLIAKVEHQEAMRAEPQVNSSGGKFIRIERIKDLVFGDQTRIYKIAVFSKSMSSGGTLMGVLADSQNGQGLAAYFLRGFLGLKLADEPEVLTESFLKGMTRAINESTLPPEDKMNAQTALSIELQSNSSNLDPASFIQRHIPTSHQGMISRIAPTVGTPMTTFPKNTSRVNSRLNRIRIDLTQGVYLVAPPEAIGKDKTVRVETVESENSAKDEVLIKISGASLGTVSSNGTR